MTANDDLISVIPVDDEVVDDVQIDESNNQEVNNDDNFFQSINGQIIHPNLQCKTTDAIIMILSYFLKHSLTWVALEELLELFHNILGIVGIMLTFYMNVTNFRIHQVKTQPCLKQSIFSKNASSQINYQSFIFFVKNVCFTSVITKNLIHVKESKVTSLVQNVRR